MKKITVRLTESELDTIRRALEIERFTYKNKIEKMLRLKYVAPFIEDYSQILFRLDEAIKAVEVAK